MATLAKHTFHGAARTPLEALVADTGEAWAKNYAASNPGSMVVSDADRLRAASGAGEAALYRLEHAFPADVDAIAVLHCLSAGDSPAVVARMPDEDNTFFMADWEAASGTWRLLVVVSGSYNQLGSYAQALAPGRDYELRLSVRAGSQKVYVDGVERISGSYNDLTPAVHRVGLRAYQSATNSTGIHVASFEVADAGGPDEGYATAPIVMAATIDAAGTTLTVTFTGVVTGGAGFSLSGGHAAGPAIGTGASRVFSITPTVLPSETVTLSYRPGDVKDAAGNDISAFSGASVTNNSARVPGLAAGTASFVSSGTSGIVLAATAARGGSGTGPSNQWERNEGGGAFSDLPGATTLTPTDATAVAGVLYEYRCKQTRGPETVTTNTIQAQVYQGGALDGPPPGEISDMLAEQLETNIANAVIGWLQANKISATLAAADVTGQIPANLVAIAGETAALDADLGPDVDQLKADVASIGAAIGKGGSGLTSIPYTGPSADAIGTGVAARILVTPANRLATTADGRVDVGKLGGEDAAPDANLVPDVDQIKAEVAAIRQELDANSASLAQIVAGIAAMPAAGGDHAGLADAVIVPATDATPAVTFGAIARLLLAMAAGDITRKTSSAPAVLKDPVSGAAVLVCTPTAYGGRAVTGLSLGG